METPCSLHPVDPNVTRQPPGKSMTSEKPSPGPPNADERTSAETALSTAPGINGTSPSQTNRPSLTGQPSFQRPRKRFIWRNKNGTIALPPENKHGRTTTRTDYLKPEDVTRRLREWEEKGFDTAGFVLASSSPSACNFQFQVQSRTVHPDPIEQEVERSSHPYRVSIPNSQEWEAFVQPLKEEKLRALGVTFGDGVPQSRKSPAPSLLSRQASSQSSVTLTPPSLHARSVASNAFGPSYQLGPGQGIEAGVSHFHRYSVGMPFGDKGFPRSSQPPVSQLPVHRSASPLGYLLSQASSRIASPSIHEHLSGIRHPQLPSGQPRLRDEPPQVPFPSLHDPRAHLLRKPSPSENQQSQFQHNEPRTQSASNKSTSQLRLVGPAGPVTPDERGIATPIPRVHRQNPSESLQREVEEAEAYLEGVERSRELPIPPSVVDEELPHSLPRVLEPETSEPPDVERLPTPDAAASASRDAEKHEGKSSLSSRLNVNAPEFKFEPKSSVNSDVFAVVPNQLPIIGAANAIQPTSVSPYARKWSQTHPLPKLNAEAPAFTPGRATPKPSVPLRIFSFGNDTAREAGLNATAGDESKGFSFSTETPSFNPDAPAFTPNDTKAIGHPKTGPKKPEIQRIFSNVDYTNVGKPAKGSKALPIVDPPAETESGEDSGAQEDESGRITQSDARQKRMRRVQDDGDEVPRFAEPPPSPLATRQAEEPSTAKAVPTVRHHRRGTTLEAPTNMLGETIDNMSASESSRHIAGAQPSSLKHTSDESLVLEGSEVSDDPGQTKSTVKRTRAAQRESSTVSLADAIPLIQTSRSGSASSIEDEPAKRTPRSATSASSSYSDPHIDASARTSQIDVASDLPHRRQDVLDGMRHVEPSYQELDSVIKHLNPDGDTDIGVERDPSPLRRSSRHLDHGRSPRQVLQETVARPLPPPVHIRSDVPSRSPSRLREPFRCLPPTETETGDSTARLVEKNARYSSSYRPSKDSPPINRLNSPGSTPPSDWNDGFSSVNETLLRSKIGFFHQRVDDVVGNILQQRLGPLEKMLSSMQDSMVRLSKQSTSQTSSGRLRSSGTVDVADSDADDEEETEDLNLTRHKSPLVERKYEQLKAFISDIAAAQQDSVSTAQIGELMCAMKELKSTICQGPQPTTPATDMKAIVEDAINRHMRGKSAPVVKSSQAAAAEKSQLQIAGLESMLKVAESHAEDEMKARRAAEDALADNQWLLRQALQETAQQRESVEATEAKLQEFNEERQHHLRDIASLQGTQEALEKTTSDLTEKNEALESTLNEYRVSHDQWRTNMDEVEREKRDVERNVRSLEQELKEAKQRRESIRSQMVQIQGQIASASEQGAADRKHWQDKAQQQKDRLDLLNARLEAEARTRVSLELEIERLEAQEKESMKARYQVEQTQKANNHLDKLVGQLRLEVHEHQNAVTRLQRENHVVKETGIMEVHRVRSTAEADIKSARSEIQAVRNELQATINGLKKQLEDAARRVAETQLAYGDMLKNASESSQAALQEAANIRESALKEHGRFHERALEQLKANHKHNIENTLEDLRQLEAHMGRKLQLENERSANLQDQVVHLEEKLEIAESAARAAVQAAQASKALTGPSVSRSPHGTRASAPEKVSPQALRESILVLQEQLQARESSIEELESQLAAVDTRAPEKLKEAHMEISWLRELLGVRIDDLQDIIRSLSQPAYHRETVRDAAIRLKTNLQMEQQEKERALAGVANRPSIVNITNLAATPRALPMAAAAAWSNWRGRRDSAYESISAMAKTRLDQTPSKNPSSSPHTDLSGLLTPPSTNVKSSPLLQDAGSRPVSSPHEFLRRPSTPVNRKQRQDQSTPPLMRKGSYDLDATESAVFAEEHEADQTEFGYNKSAYEITTHDEAFGPRLGISAG